MIVSVLFQIWKIGGRLCKRKKTLITMTSSATSQRHLEYFPLHSSIGEGGSEGVRSEHRNTERRNTIIIWTAVRTSILCCAETVWKTISRKLALFLRGASGLSMPEATQVWCGLLIAPRKLPLTPHLNWRFIRVPWDLWIALHTISGTRDLVFSVSSERLVNLTR